MIAFQSHALSLSQVLPFGSGLAIGLIAGAVAGAVVVYRKMQ